VVFDNLSFDTQYFVGIAVDSDPTMVDRQILGASAYSLGSLGNFNVKQNMMVGGNMGIGLSNPSMPLDIYGDCNVATVRIKQSGTTQNDSAPVLNVVQSSQTNSSGIKIDFNSTYGGNPASYPNTAALQITNASAHRAIVVNNAAGSRLFEVNANGYVGIGTNSPNAALDVRGNACFSGDISIPTASGLYLDGGTNTYIKRESGGYINFKFNGSDVCYMSPGAFAIPANVAMYIDSGSNTYFQKGGGNQFDFYCGNVLAASIRQGGLIYAHAYYYLSPDIRKDEKYKDKAVLTNKDYLDWALEDAKKPIKRTMVCGNEIVYRTLNANEFRTKQDVDNEYAKYEKDAGKITLGTCIGRKVLKTTYKRILKTLSP